MKSNQEGALNVQQPQKIVNLPSREVTPQPVLKFNVGPGNNFIVKNSNILITQNNINKQQNNPSYQNINDGNSQYQTSLNQMNGQLKQKPGSHQRAYSFEQKARLYGAQGNQFVGNNPQAQAIPIQNQDIGTGSRNQARFAQVATGMASKPNTNQQNSNNLNNSYKHQNRKLSYSPILKQSSKGSRKKNVPEEILKMPQRRAHSKNEKYPHEEGTLLEQEDSVDVPPHYSTHTGQNFLIQNSFEKQQQLPQRFSPLQYASNGQTSGMNQIRQEQELRPSSATLKRKEGGSKRSEELQSNLRQLLQQNAQQNKENKKLIQQKLAAGTKQTGQKVTPLRSGVNNDFLNNLMNNQGKQNNTGLYFMNGQQVQQKPNSRQNVQKPNESLDGQVGRSNLDKAFQAYNSGNAKRQQELGGTGHSRSKSFSENKQNQSVHQSNNDSQHENLAGDRNKSRQGHKRPKSNLDMIPSQQKTSNNFFQQPVVPARELEAQELKGKSEDGQRNQRMQSIPIKNNLVPQPNERSHSSAQVQPPTENLQPKQYSFFSGNPQQMYTNCVTKFAFATKTGLAPSNPNKVNQDNWITVPHFCGLKFCHFFSVCDGHGQYGREVSTFLKNRLPQYLENEFRYVLQKYQETNTKNQKDDLLNTDEICIAFNNAFLDANEELFSGILDIRFSGSTCVSLITLGQKLFCSNVGDSRGIIVKKMPDGKVIAQAVSRDQKPNQPDEAERVIKSGGRIDSFRDPDRNPIGPLRVWLKHEDIPGLAMTRSFGDEVAGRVGVIAEPEILELDLCKDDKFIVLASDGVWEFISNEEVASIVLPFFEKRNAEGAAEALVRESYLRWKQEEDDIIDDITCVIIFLDVKLPQQQPSANV